MIPPPEIVALLDHAFDHGLDLRDWPEGTEYTGPVATNVRVIEGDCFSTLCHVPCWTVDVHDPDCHQKILEWRDEERRWVGFGSGSGWKRFYEGPQLEVSP